MNHSTNDPRRGTRERGCPQARPTSRATTARGLPRTCALQALHSERPLYWHDYADAWLNFPLGKVLDYGCGKGDFLRRIADRADERWGVDIDPEVVAEAGRPAGDQLIVLFRKKV